MSEQAPLAAKIALLILKQHNLLERELQVSRHFPLDIADYLRTSGARLRVQEPFVPERAKKSAQEARHIRESAKNTERAFEIIEKILRAGTVSGERILYEGRPLTSEFLKREVGRLFFERGMENSDGLIISCGVQAAMPHHRGSGILHPHQTIVCDIFPRNIESGYFADLTRTYVKGKPPPEIQRMYAAVKEARQKAYNVLRPRVPACDVYAAAAEAVTAAGFDVGEKGFTHGLGHGVGLEVHEPPHLSAHSKDILEVGTIVTIEPGLYYPQWGGVRLEGMVAVTETGYEKLTEDQKEWIIP